MAYGVPAVVHALKKRKSYVRKRPSPTCLVLAPSSEAVQLVRSIFHVHRICLMSVRGE